MSGQTEDEKPDLSSPRLLPKIPLTRDRALPILVFVSILLHVFLIVPLLTRDPATPHAPREIPVELVQLPPPKPPEPKKPAEPKKSAEPKKPEAEQKKQDPKPPEKPPEPKKVEKPPEAKKPEKQPAPRKQEAKKEEPKKQEAKKQEAAKQPEKPQESVSERMQHLLGPQSLDPIAMPGESDTGTDLVSYGQIVMSRLTKALRRDRHPGRQTYATVSFLIGDTGEVAQEDLTRMSGDSLLDEEALAVVKRAAPYPPPPPGGKRDYTITLESRPEP